MKLLPPGLTRCRVCNEARGIRASEHVVVNCICDGVPCIRCGRNLIRRPLTNYYDDDDGRVWHVLHFLTACRQCLSAVSPMP